MLEILAVNQVRDEEPLMLYFFLFIHIGNYACESQTTLSKDQGELCFHKSFIDVCLNYSTSYLLLRRCISNSGITGLLCAGDKIPLFLWSNALLFEYQEC